MKVIAMRQGFYAGARKKPGTIFDWNPKDRLGRWVKEVDPKVPIARQMPVEANPPPADPDWKKISMDADPPIPKEKFAKFSTARTEEEKAGKAPTKGKTIAKSLIKKSKSLKKSTR